MKKVFDLLLKIGFIIFNFFFYLSQKQVKKDVFQITKNIKFKIRPNTIDPFVVVDNFYLKEYLKESEIKPTDIIVDIGSHIGSFSVFCSQYAKKVISYEASPLNYKLFVENIRLNSIKNIDAHNIAVYSKKCKINFFHDKENTGGNSLFLKNQKQKMQINAIPLSQIIIDRKLNKIDFLKMDIEGAEYDVLLNTPKKYLNKISKIALEYHDYLPTNHNVQELKNFLEKNGFEVKIIAWPIISQIYKSGLLKATR